MLIQLGYELVFQVPARTPMLLMLYVHPSQAAALRTADWIRIEPDCPVELFTDPFGNYCGRLVAPPGQLRLWSTTLIEDSGAPDAVHLYAPQQPVEELPPATLPYLLGSRYCEVDKLTEVAWSLFGQTPLGWPRAQAVCDWVNHNVRFGYEFANPSRSAADVFRERTGVCRDLNHLALTFCRCLGIPARYVTGYLGDICVPASPAPMDFSGWFEAYLGGRWHTFDARHNTPRDRGQVAAFHGLRSQVIIKPAVWRGNEDGHRGRRMFGWHDSTHCFAGPANCPPVLHPGKKDS